MGWINSTQFERDHNGQRNICAADGRPGTAERPLAVCDEGFRVHAEHFDDPTSGLYGHRQQATEDVDAA